MIVSMSKCSIKTKQVNLEAFMLVIWMFCWRIGLNTSNFEHVNFYIRLRHGVVNESIPFISAILPLSPSATRGSFWSHSSNSSQRYLCSHLHYSSAIDHSVQSTTKYDYIILKIQLYYWQNVIIQTSDCDCVKLRMEKNRKFIDPGWSAIRDDSSM